MIQPLTVIRTTLTLIAFAGLMLSSLPVLAQPADTQCPEGQTLQHTFNSGAAWDMCWQTSTAEGVVLSNIYYTTPAGVRRRILGSASIAQIQTDYDDGTSSNLLSATTGLGGDSLQTLSDAHCPTGTLHQSSGRAVLCANDQPLGYVMKHPDVMKQGRIFELINVSAVDNRNYATRWHFYENGIIKPAIGLSGNLPKTGDNAAHGWPVTANNVIGVSFTDHYFWRLDFDLAQDPNNDIVEEHVSLPSYNRQQKVRTFSTLSSESARPTNWENKRWWRVRDGSVSNGNSGHISYELITLNHVHQSDGNHGQSWLANDIFFTRYKACEQLATNNSTSDCGGHISQFVDGENLNEADVVVWYRMSYHHLPRDEDINRVPIRWSGFELLPRDWSASNPML